MKFKPNFDLYRPPRWNDIAAWILMAFIFVVVFFGNCIASDWEPIAADTTGWAIRKVFDAYDLNRVWKFDEKWDCCAFIMQRIIDAGGFKVFNEMRKDFCEGWYTVLLDVPVDYFLLIDENSAFVLNGVCKGDTIAIDSERIVFGLGWGFTGLSGHLNQKTILDNNEQPIQVKWIEEPGEAGKTTFEYNYLNKEKNQGINKYYIVGYAYFGDVPDVENINWSFSGINMYRR